MTDATYELFTDPWGALLQERCAHQATLELLWRYRKQAEQFNGTGGILEGRCRLCSEPRGGIGQEYRAKCVCHVSAEHLSTESARLAKEPRRGKKASENLFAVEQAAKPPVELAPLPQATLDLPEPPE